MLLIPRFRSHSAFPLLISLNPYFPSNSAVPSRILLIPRFRSHSAFPLLISLNPYFRSNSAEPFYFIPLHFFPLIEIPSFPFPSQSQQSSGRDGPPHPPSPGPSSKAQSSPGGPAHGPFLLLNRHWGSGLGSADYTRHKFDQSQKLGERMGRISKMVLIAFFDGSFLFVGSGYFKKKVWLWYRVSEHKARNKDWLPDFCRQSR